jgi:ABC-type glycerol-3-phosphate transport system substrate-binding protein
MKKRTLWTLLSTLLIAGMLLAACGPKATEAPPAEEPAPAEEEPAPAGEAIPLSLWYHGAGNPEERSVIVQIIEDFNASQDEYVVEMQDFPQDSYNESIVAAALAGDLPDIIDWLSGAT